MRPDIHLLVVGPGALGCLVVAALSRGMEGTGSRLSVLDHDRNRADLLNRQGICCELDGNRRRFPIPVTADPETAGPADVVILCVKSYDVLASLASCRPLLTEGTVLLFLQNGIAHLDCGDAAGEAAIAYGTTTEGATLLNPGHVRHAGHGATFLGFPSPADAHSTTLLHQTAAICSRGGLTTTMTDDILHRLWAKLFVNVGINALTAIHGCANGDLLTLPGIVERMRTAVAEAERVARAGGIVVTGDPYSATVEVCRKTADNISSMLQDVRRRRRTEIDAINGAIVREGRSLGLETPENLRLVEQIRAIEAGYAAPH
ncbi:2-dehydropantoate 2-reductase [Desulfoprunum benzoelyticum]|uniref:2-dehydropantoate 2-reductase n=1 Tax=Desulfoprunum benzoelyticum TaxID=1506996 RepID=A0A840V1Q7_9BACT|nr:2-dehydropantoate 2-reductase [Desulfoprunum benzoelyticum]MBB5347111.1 2-dehydropantoate 2-reductase [Desulfoprunum benzoelyticum]MBM9529804.1 2-dehydropantoate 2-reductase [Desulfoprunum benzoelyticum]